MAPRDEKKGRPRRYAFGPVAGVAHRRAAYYLGVLDELSERHFDLIEDLPADVLGWVPAPGWFSPAMITAHMAQAEGSWVALATGQAAPEDVTAPLAAWRKAEGPVPPAAEIIAPHSGDAEGQRRQTAHVAELARLKSRRSTES